MSEPTARRVGSAMSWQAVLVGSDQTINLLRFFILARLLAPEDFGLLAIATIAVDMLLTVTYMGMMPAIIQRRDASPRHYHAAWTVNVLRGAAVSFVVILTAPLIAQLFDEPRAVNLIRLVAVRPLLSAFLSVRTYDLRRDLDFRRLTIIDVPPNVIQTVVAIALVPLMGVYALAAGMIAHAVSHVLLSYVVSPYRPKLTFGGEAARALLRYGRWILATSIVGVVGESLLRMVVSRQLGTAELGLYYLAAKLVELPSNLIGSVLYGVAFPLHARFQDERERAAATFRSNVTAFLASLVPLTVGLGVLAPALVRDVLGERWDGAAPVIRILAVGIVLSILRAAAAPLIEGHGRPEWATALYTARSIFLIVGVVLLAPPFGLVGAAFAVVVAELMVMIMSAGLALRLLPSPFHGLWKPAAASGLATACAAAVAVGIDNLVGPPSGFAAAAVAAGLVGVGLLAALDRLLDVGMLAQLLRALPFLRRLPLLRRMLPTD